MNTINPQVKDLTPSKRRLLLNLKKTQTLVAVYEGDNMDFQKCIVWDSTEASFLCFTWNSRKDEIMPNGFWRYDNVQNWAIQRDIKNASFVLTLNKSKYKSFCKKYEIK